MSAAGEGLVYEIHFDQPIGDPENPKGWAQHYIGHTEDLDRRMAEHRGGHTAAIMRAVNEAGIGWRVVRTWPGTRDTERAIKDLHSGRRLCPQCTEHPLTGAGAVARAAALRSDREAARAAVPEPPRPAPVPPYEAGRQMGRQFMAQQNAAGRTAAQIEATHEYITGPWHEMGHHTADQAERFRGYTELITAALGLIREAEAEGPPAQHEAEAEGPPAQHEMEAEAGPDRPGGNELEERMQYDADGNAAGSADHDADAAQYEHDPGSWLARDGDGQVLEVDTDGHPGREASPDDGRAVAEAEMAGDLTPAEFHERAANIVAFGDTSRPGVHEAIGEAARRLEVADHEAARDFLARAERAAEAESGDGQAYVDDAGLESAAYWGGEGPTWEAQAEATTAEPAPGTGPHDVPWWDGERMASDRDRTPDRVAEMEAEAG